MRLRDDGTVPPDNPFAGRAGYKPEIYSMGHRNTLGLIVHPVTGALWNNENGPNGGDEINIILPGRNYGWPVASYGRTYEGPRVSEVPWREGIEQPIVFWVPSIAVAGMAVYTGDRFPAWKNNVFVGSMRMGEIPGTGHLERIVFNDKTEELRRETHADRTAPADPRGSPGPRRAAVSPDGRRRGRAAQDRTRALTEDT